MENACKKAWILRLKIEKNALNIALKIHTFLDVVFGRILGGFGRGFGRVWEAFLATLRDFFRTFYDMLTILKKNWIWEAFWRGLGRLLGRFWEDFGRLLGGSGSLLDAFGRSEDAFWQFLAMFMLF